MKSWPYQIQELVDIIDEHIKSDWCEEIALDGLSMELGYSPYYVSRMFKAVTGMTLQSYVVKRKLAFAVKALRDTNLSVFDIAQKHGFASTAPFSRAFKKLFGLSPRIYRQSPCPLVLRTKLSPLDCYCVGVSDIDSTHETKDVRAYFVSIPAHKFLFVGNKESNGYWDFWEKQRHIPGQDCETICGLLDSIEGKLDDLGGLEANSGGGQIMAYMNDPAGVICDWGYPRMECYGVRLPMDYMGCVPDGMNCVDVDEAVYIVFEHGPFNYQIENRKVEAKIERAMKDFDLSSKGYQYDMTLGRMFYFYHDPKRFWKYIRPVVKTPE